MPERAHEPVLLDEVLRTMLPIDGRWRRVIDGTVGAGGHSAALLQAGVEQLLGLDRDERALALAEEQMRAFGARAHLRQANFADMAEHAAALGWRQVDGILLDLGLSSMQLDCARRGFSTRLDGPLDMRFDRREDMTAAAWLNAADETELAHAFYQYGEERRSRRLARALVDARPLRSTGQLRELVERQLRPEKRRRSAPAARIFQATRIVVNDELGALQRALPAAMKLLRPGGRLVVISFHSLEDRIVKRAFRDASRDCLCPPAALRCECGHQALGRRLTRKPLRPSAAEIARNPRSRSARLRALEALA